MQSADAFNPVNLHWVLISHANIPLMQSVMRNRKLLAQTAPFPIPLNARTRTSGCKRTCTIAAIVRFRQDFEFARTLRVFRFVRNRRRRRRRRLFH